MTLEELRQHCQARTAEGLAYLERYTPTFVADALACLATPLGTYIAFTDSADVSAIDVAGHRIAVYANLLWARLSKWQTVECDLLAWTTRNVLETHLWARFATSSEENAKAFISEADIDQKELFNAFLQQGDPRDIGHAVVSVLADRIGGKRTAVRAENTDDPLLHKQCSKYVHATAWIINGFDRHMNDEYVRRQLVAFSLHHLAEITRSLLESSHETVGILCGEPN